MKMSEKFNLKDSVWEAVVSKYTRAGAEHILRVCPYKLAINQDVSFDAVDEYVMSRYQIDKLCPARIGNALLCTLNAIEQGTSCSEPEYYAEIISSLAGSTCIPKSLSYDLLESILKLDEGDISVSLLDRVIKNLVSKGKISVNRIGSQVYLANKSSFTVEKEAAEIIKSLLERDGLVRKDVKSRRAMYRAVDAAQAATALLLSQEQKNAVCTALQSSLSVLTGGPGTGKSATQKILVESLNILRPEARIRCIAPTGQAASRMTEATGLAASTIHSALSILPGQTVSHARINDDLVLVDEASMIDARLFTTLLKSISERTSIVFIGDAAQLPSISSGNVLAELIQSHVPLSQLTKVFRQGDNSIAFNCAKIKNGNVNLEMDDSFTFIECIDSESISKEVCRIYREEALKNGLGSVCCLTPLRHNTKTGVNKLNRAIRSAVHDTRALSWCERDGIRIYTGDKILFLRNKSGLVNGEIGTAVKCAKDLCICRFGDKEITLKGDDLLSIEPAYAQTVHKAQGQEYKTCIIVMDEKHASFLNKSLVYTSVSRAKKKCICVGSLKVMQEAISKETGNERCSCLAWLIETN